MNRQGYVTSLIEQNEMLTTLNDLSLDNMQMT